MHCFTCHFLLHPSVFLGIAYYIPYSTEFLSVCLNGHNLYSEKPDGLNIFV